MKKHLSLLTLALLALGTLSLCAQDSHPDFSGTWNLDVAKSDFGPMPPSTSEKREIEHKDPKLKVKSTSVGQQGERKTESNYTTDGKENTNTQGPMEVKSTSKWDGKKLVTLAKADFQGNPIEFKDTWELAEDGKMHTLTREIKGGFGEFTVKLIFNKE